MNKYAIKDYEGRWLFDIQADSQGDAVYKAKQQNPDANSAELVAEGTGSHLSMH